MKDLKKVKMGKASRAAGARFEIRVREDLEKRWIVDKWGNNVEFNYPDILGGKLPIGILVKAKPKFVFNPQLKRRIPMGMSSGFPDFIAFKTIDIHAEMGEPIKTHNFTVIGVESKMDGKLDKLEKEKCVWLLKNNIFSKILIAFKGEKRGTIEYIEFNR